jgi:hypothetical protein
MTLDFKRAKLAVEQVTDEGKISGYANVYGIKDLGNDIVAHGAFADSIKGKTFPMLWGHDQFEPPIGVWEIAKEDSKGLYVEGQITLGMTKARDVFEGIKAKSVSGLSVGFKTLDADEDEKSGIRTIKKADLWEVSVVTFPMNTESRIDAAKAASMTEREIELKLTQDAGFSRSVARLLMKGGFSAIHSMQDAGEGKAVHAMLSSILTELRTMRTDK